MCPTFGRCDDAFFLYFFFAPPKTFRPVFPMTRVFLSVEAMVFYCALPTPYLVGLQGLFKRTRKPAPVNAVLENATALVVFEVMSAAAV